MPEQSQLPCPTIGLICTDRTLTVASRCGHLPAWVASPGKAWQYACGQAGAIGVNKSSCGQHGEEAPPLVGCAAWLPPTAWPPTERIMSEGASQSQDHGTMERSSRNRNGRELTHPGLSRPSRRACPAASSERTRGHSDPRQSQHSSGPPRTVHRRLVSHPSQCDTNHLQHHQTNSAIGCSRYTGTGCYR